MSVTDNTEILMTERQYVLSVMMGIS
jgi:hypothetical protein